MVIAALLIATFSFTHEARQNIEAQVTRALKSVPAVQKAKGVVTFAKGEFFFIQGDDDAIKVIWEDGSKPSVGEVVEASGRPILEGGRVILEAKSVRRLGHAPLPEAKPAELSDLISPVDPRKANWRRVRVVGQAVGLSENGFSLDVEGTPMTVVVEELPAFIKDSGSTHPKVAVCAVAELFLDQSVFFGREGYVIGVRLCVAAPDDLALLPDAGYLLRRRGRLVTRTLTFVVGGLTVVLLLLAFVAFRHRRRQLRTETVMAERKRMADDLHDTIEQHLAGAGMLIKLARMPQNRLNPSADRPLQEAQDVLLRAKHEMRDIVWGLKSDDMAKLTPTQMLQKLAADETRRGVFRIRTHLRGLPAKMPLAEMRDLSLIVREAIGNAVKHGVARDIAIDATGDGNGRWLIRVANNGEPFDRSTVPGPAEGHFGLAGMEERARRIGVALSFGRKGKWTAISLEKK